MVTRCKGSKRRTKGKEKGITKNQLAKKVALWFDQVVEFIVTLWSIGPA